MKRYYLLFLFILCSLTGFRGEATPSSYKVVGYYPNWGMYHHSQCLPLDLPGHLLTHINYAFVKVDEAGTIHLFDPWADTDYRHDWNTEKPFWGHFEQFVRLKEKYPHLKTLVSVGGWTLSDPFSVMADEPIARKRFAENCVAFCKKYHFNGVDLDWEYPGFAEHKGRPEDKENFTLLLAELSSALKKENLLLTIAAPAADPHLHNMDVEKIHHYLDWINVMTYDYHGPWVGQDAVTNHLAPLYPPKEGDPTFCVEATIKAYLAEGVPAEKIVMGLPFYGRSFEGVEGGKTGLYCAYKGVGHGTTIEKGVVFYSEFENLIKAGYLRLFDPVAQAYYLYHPEKQEFISYDDGEVIKTKCNYVKQLGLGGVMFWELTNDQLPEYKLLQEIHYTLSKR